MADMNSGRSDKALLISPTDRNWLKNLPGKSLVRVGILVAVGAGMLKRIAFTQTHRQTDIHK